jgi:hypothetical protein
MAFLLANAGGNLVTMGLRYVRLADGWLLMLICSERKVLLAGG